MADTDSAAIGPALEQKIDGPHRSNKRMDDDDMAGYGSGPKNPGPPQPPLKEDSGDDFMPVHPPVDHNGHHTGKSGMCLGCGSKRCMGGCGYGGKRM